MASRAIVRVTVLGNGERKVITPPSPSSAKRYEYVGATWPRGVEHAVFELRDRPTSPPRPANVEGV
jgi:hypothetical protein